MKLVGEFRLMGVERGVWSDSGKSYYTAGFAGGMDSVRVGVTAEQYESLMELDIDQKYVVEFNFNPLSKSVRYCMTLKSVSEISTSRPAGVSADIKAGDKLEDKATDVPTGNMGNKKAS